MYLLDTNIFLEYILRRPRVREVRDFFQRIDPFAISISDFSLHTLGVIYTREHKPDKFLVFVNEDILASGIRILSIEPEHFSGITGAAARFDLDFDDAYQYAVAEQYNLTIISYDRDFDRTPKGRKEPKDIR